MQMDNLDCLYWPVCKRHLVFLNYVNTKWKKGAMRGVSVKNLCRVYRTPRWLSSLIKKIFELIKGALYLKWFLIHLPYNK